MLRRALSFIAATGAVLNVAAGVFYGARGETLHGGLHGVVALGLGYLALWLLRRPDVPAPPSQPALPEDDRIESLQDQITDLHRELIETRQGRDIAEQLLEERAKKHDVDPQRYAPKPKSNEE